MYVCVQVAMGEDGTYIAREAQEEYIYSQMKVRHTSSAGRLEILHLPWPPFYEALPL